jgi:hypothetical protein
MNAFVRTGSDMAIAGLKCLLLGGLALATSGAGPTYHCPSDAGPNTDAFNCRPGAYCKPVCPEGKVPDEKGYTCYLYQLHYSFLGWGPCQDYDECLYNCPLCLQHGSATENVQVYEALGTCDGVHFNESGCSGIFWYPDPQIISVSGDGISQDCGITAICDL